MRVSALIFTQMHDFINYSETEQKCLCGSPAVQQRSPSTTWSKNSKNRSKENSVTLPHPQGNGSLPRETPSTCFFSHGESGSQVSAFHRQPSRMMTKRTTQNDDGTGKGGTQGLRATRYRTRRGLRFLLTTSGTTPRGPPMNFTGYFTYRFTPTSTHILPMIYKSLPHVASTPHTCLQTAHLSFCRSCTNTHIRLLNFVAFAECT